MAPSLTLWTHALAALLFGLLAIRQWRQPGGGLPRAGFIVALGATALWALAVAGIGSRDTATQLAEAVRDLAWLAFMAAVLWRVPVERSSRVAAVYIVCAALTVIAAVMALCTAIVADPATLTAITDARTALRTLAAIATLVLVHHFQAVTPAASRDGIRMAAVALAIMAGFDFAIHLVTGLTGAWPDGLIGGRGMAMVVLAPMFGLAIHRDGEWTLRLSRSIVYQAIAIVLIGSYVGLTGFAIGYVARLFGGQARLAQTALIFGTSAAMLTLVSTPWLRAWGKVLVAKHLFSHRYDYRVEWLRFTETLGTPGGDAAPLSARVVKAVADLTDSPAGLLLVAGEGRLEQAANWNWPDGVQASGDDGAALHAHLAATHRIIELDAVRAAVAPPGDVAATPAWLRACADAWAIVPLVHFERLAGAIVLARPPLDRALDWEDFDLLGVAGRQAASYLAEDRAHDALAEAQRFDEFNRRFAFIMHDLKNLVSQLTLVARNAERHAGNPAFRADMVATLRDSSRRMNSLLARLAQHHHGAGATPREVALAPLAQRIAAARRAQHPVVVRGDAADAATVAMADPAALETLLDHLVQNAIEASAADAVVTLDIVGPVAPGRVAIDVIDHGCGMSQAFVRDQLFKPFVSSKPGGFGVGAFEARQMAEAMGGAVTVDSREHEGTRFRVILRAAGDDAVGAARHATGEMEQAA